MKKIITIAIISMFLLSFVSAQSDLSQKAGILPGSFLYKADLFLEQFKYDYLLNGDEAKMTYSLEKAQERFAEMNKVESQELKDIAEAEQLRLMERYQKRYNNAPEEIQEKIKLKIQQHNG